MAFRNLFVFILAMFLVFAVLSANFYLEWPPLWFVHLPVLAIVLGGMLLFTFVNYSPREVAIAFRDLFSPATEKKRSDYENASRVFRTMARYAWASAGFAFIIGLIKLLWRVTDPETIAPNMAFSLFSVLYGLVFGEIVCGLCEGQAEKRLVEFERNAPPSEQRSFHFAIVILIFLAAIIFILYCAIGMH